MRRSPLAAILATVGLYGVTVRAVARRTREIGIRVALGATPSRAASILMSDILGGVLIGLALGIPLALLLAGVAVIASGLPARRASRSNPASVLKAD